MTKLDTLKDPDSAAREMLDTFTAMAQGDSTQAREYAKDYAEKMQRSPSAQERAVAEKLKSLVAQPY